MSDNSFVLQVVSPEPQQARLARLLSPFSFLVSYHNTFTSNTFNNHQQTTVTLLHSSLVSEKEGAELLVDVTKHCAVVIVSDKPLVHKARMHFLTLGVVDCLSITDAGNGSFSEELTEALYRCERQQKAINTDKKAKDYQHLQEAYALLEEDQHLALQVQQKIQPPVFSIIERYCLSYRVCPSQWLSGDFVHYAQVNDNELLVVLGDVSGHGASSAMVVTAIRYLIYRWSDALSKNDEKFSLTALLKAVNAELFVMDADKHVTLLAACIDIKTGEVSLTSAGHLPLALHKTPQKTDWVVIKGQPLGLFPHVVLNEVQLILNPEDSLVFCSDGALELQGEKSIKAQEKSLLSKVTSLQPDINEIFKSFNLPVEGDLADDVAVLVVQRM